MPKLHPAPVADVADNVFAELQSYLAGPGKPAPPGFRLKLAAPLASTIGRVRLFETTDGRRTKLLEFAVGGVVEAADTGIAAARLATAAERAGLHAGEDVDVALDLTVDPATGSLSIDLAAERVLEGQDLASLAAAVAPDPAPPVPDFDLSLDDSYLTAADAARFLGVAKSTVTRRIEKNELVGFRVFKNALRIPRDQFMDGDVVDGLADVLALFAIESDTGETVIDHKSAWAFLGSTVYPGDAAPRPIDRLRAASPGRPAGRSGGGGVGPGQAEPRSRRSHLSASSLTALPPARRARVARLFQGLRTMRVLVNFVRVMGTRHSAEPFGVSGGPSRFSPLSAGSGGIASFGVLYLAEDLATAVYETLIRDRFDLNPSRVLMPDDQARRDAVNVSSSPGETLTLLDLTRGNAVRYGVPSDVIRHSVHTDG